MFDELIKIEYSYVTCDKMQLINMKVNKKMTLFFVFLPLLHPSASSQL